MKLGRTIRNIAISSIACVCFTSISQAQAAKAQNGSSEWKDVEGAMGRSGKLQPDGTFKFSMPRKDLSVTVNGTPIKAGLALGSWAVFEGTHRGLSRPGAYKRVRQEPAVHSVSRRFICLLWDLRWY